MGRAAQRARPSTSTSTTSARTSAAASAAWSTSTTSDGTVVSRHLPPRYFKRRLPVTAWTQRPEDEHRLLSSLLDCFLRHETLPAELLDGTLAELGLPVPLTVALPPPEDRSFADVWSALGGELKPSLDLVVSAPVDGARARPAGTPVERAAHPRPARPRLGPTATRPGRPPRAAVTAESAESSDERGGIGPPAAPPTPSGRTRRRGPGRTRPVRRSDLQHLLARLALVEARVRQTVAARRAVDPAPDDPFRGLYCPTTR